MECIRGNAQVLERLFAESEPVAITVISVCELYFGAAKSRSAASGKALVDRFLEGLNVLGVGIDAARLFGETKAALERAGQRLPDADLLIAAICLAHRATLVTGNGRHFTRIPALATEDWIRS